MVNAPKVVVLGAYGYTGKLICEELRKTQVDFVISGRNSEKIKELKETLNIETPTIIGDITSREFCQSLVTNFSIIINCIGPFFLWSKTLVEVASSSNVVYLDITGELGFVVENRKKWHEQAIQNKSTIVSSCSFESFVSVLLAQFVFPNETDIQSIHTYYSFNNYLMSSGTKLTSTLSRHENLFFWSNGIFQNVNSDNLLGKRELKSGEIIPVCTCPYPEIAFFVWDYKLKYSNCWLKIREDELSFRKALFEKKPDSLENVLKKQLRRKNNSPSAERRSVQQFRIDLDAESTKGDFFTGRVEGQDPYGLTAKIMSLMVSGILKTDLKVFGVVSPVSVIDSKKMIEKLTHEAGLHFTSGQQIGY